MFFFLLSGSSTLLTRKSWNRFSHRWPNHTACRTGLHNTSNTHKVTWHKKKFVCYTNIFQILELASHIYWFSVINLILKANCFLFIFSILLNSDFYTRRRNYTNGSENIIFSCKKKNVFFRDCGLLFKTKAYFLVFVITISNVIIKMKNLSEIYLQSKQ